MLRAQVFDSLHISLRRRAASSNRPERYDKTAGAASVAAARSLQAKVSAVEAKLAAATASMAEGDLADAIAEAQAFG